MDTKAHASSSSLSSSPRHASPTRTAGMSTPKTARPRIPLGELPISSLLSAANASASSPSSTTGVSPILKPVATRHFAGSPTRSKQRAVAPAVPHTPPHHETHPVNVRPHHAHVATGLGLDSPGHSRSAAALPASPTTCVAPATPPPSLLKRQHGPTSSSSPAAAVAQQPISSSSSSSASPQHPQGAAHSLPRRKRDRIDDATEHVLARERGQDPVWTSPSPHKNAAIAAAAAAAAGTAPPSNSRRYNSAHAHSHHHHRRMSSTGSAKAFALSPRFAAAKSLAPVAGGSALDDEEEEDDEEDELRETEEMVAVKPLRINSPRVTSMAPPSSKSATPPRSATAAAPALGEDVFGVTTSSPSGGLVVFCDDENNAFPHAAAVGKGSADRYAGEDGANRENDVSLLEKFLGDSTSSGASKKHGKSKSKSPSLSMGGSSSPGPGGALSSPMKRKKGTGGRLSLVATGEAGQAVDGEEGDGAEDDDEEGEESG